MAAVEGMRLSRNISRLLLSLHQRNFIISRSSLSCSSFLHNNDSNSRTKGPGARDPFPIFMSGRVQKILQKITGFDVDKIHKPRPVERVKRRTYRLLTDEELMKEQREALFRTQEKLQMPPFMTTRDDSSKVVAKDPELGDILDSKFVLVDTKYPESDRDRFITVREPDGTLRTATGSERDRFNQLYKPRFGRSIYPPRMFYSVYLKQALDRKQYVYLMDKACIQFEPDNEDFIRISQEVYEHILKEQAFDELRSTRYFGPMAFYYCWNQKMDLLLLDMMDRGLVLDAANLIKLYWIINMTQLPDEHKNRMAEFSELDLLKHFCEYGVAETYKQSLAQAIQSYEESLQSEPKEASSA